MHQNVCLSVCYHLDVQYKKFIFFIFLEIDICSCVTCFLKYLSEEVDVSELAESIVLLFQNKAKNEGANDNICAAMDELSNALNTQQVQSLMKDLEREHSDNPNFKLWSSYMSMVEILLDFIWAEREGNWNLHLEAFAAMLPWLIIYDHTNYAKWGPVCLAEMKNLENTAPEVYAEFMSENFV